MKKLFTFILSLGVMLCANAQNPFAYGLSSEAYNTDTRTLKIHYSINAPATAVNALIKNANGEVVRTVSIYSNTTTPMKKGTYTATLDMTGLGTGNFTWEIQVTGGATSGSISTTPFASWGFYHPCGLDVDNSPESPSFGTIFVAEGYFPSTVNMANRKTFISYPGSNGEVSDASGLYMFTPALESIKGKDGYARFYPSFLTHSHNFAGTAYGADFSKVAVAEDGRIFVSRHNDLGDYILSAESVESLKNGGTFASLLAGKSMTNKIYNDADGNFLVGGVQSMDVKGSGGNTKIIALTSNEHSTAGKVECTSAVEYEIGTGSSLTSAISYSALDKNSTVSYDRGANVAYDNRGGVWFCQFRSSSSDIGLAYVNANGVKTVISMGGSRCRGAVAVSPDGTMLAASSGLHGLFTIYKINYAEDGTVSLSKIEEIDLSTRTTNVNIYATAWDIAGNFYCANAYNEWVNGYAVPRANNTVATPAASKYAFTVTENVPMPTAIAPTAGAANPFAYGLSSGQAVTDGNGSLTVDVKYSLNADAVAASAVIKKAGMEVKRVELTGLTKGTHETTIDIKGVGHGEFTWAVEVEGAEKTNVEEFASFKFYHPRGIDVDNNMESDAFGNIYITEGISTTKTGYYQANGGVGLYIFNPDMTGVMNEVTGNYAFMGGLTYSFITYGADLARVRVAEDGRIFVTRCNNAGDYILYAPSHEDLVNNDTFTSLLAGGTLDASTYEYKVGSSVIARPNVGLDVKGSGEDLKIVAVSGNKNLFSLNQKASFVDEYALGNAETLPATANVQNLSGYIAAPQTANVEYDNRGGIWFSQYRGIPDNVTPALIYVDANGAEKKFEGAGGYSRGGGGIRFSPDYSQIAIASSKTEFTIYDIEYTADNTPLLTPVTTISHGIGTNVYDIAWDLAGNIYICGNSSEYMKGFALPRTSNVFATEAPSKYALNIDQATAVGDIATDANAPVEYYNLQGVKVENPSNGVFIKKQGSKTTKVVL